MSDTARRFYGARRDGHARPRMEDIMVAVAQNGLGINHSYSPDINDDQLPPEEVERKATAEAERRNLEFRNLVALVGLKRSVSLDVDADIKTHIQRLARDITLDGRKLDDGLATTLTLLDTSGQNTAHVDRTAEARYILTSIITRIENAYDKVLGPSSDRGASPA